MDFLNGLGPLGALAFGLACIVGILVALILICALGFGLWSGFIKAKAKHDLDIAELKRRKDERWP